MRLWRKIVSVLAGTMIAAGGIVGTLAVLEGTAPTSTGSPDATGTSQWLFSEGPAEAAVSLDVEAVGGWLNTTAAGGGTIDRQTAYDAALASAAVAEVATTPPAPPYYGQVREAFEPAVEDATAGGVQAAADAHAITTAWNQDGTAGAVDANASAGDRVVEVATVVLTTYALSSVGSTAAADEVVESSPEVKDTPVADVQGALQGAPTTSVARLALTPDPVASHANWTAGAADEVGARAAAGTLGDDTLSLALSSQVLHTEDPARAAAVNAELATRQRADGSFDGSIEATAESVRALAVSDLDSDRGAAARGLDWLDAQQGLAPAEATWRLRAHAVDSHLGAVPGPQAMEGAAPFGLTLGGPAAKGVLSLLFLAGGIGLSLTLVTSDALKGARRRLYDTIRAEPGLHVNELRRRLRMSPSSVEYHLSVLIGAGLVVSEDDGRYKRFYANGAGLGLNPGSPNSRNAVGALRRPHATEIVQHLLERESGTAREVSRALALHESAVSRRLDHLERSGLLTSARVGRERRYQVLERQAAIKALTLVEPSAPAPAPQDATADAAPERGASDGVTAVSP
jgi:DNA-binding transcriptional ArsR family regulator